MASPSTAITRFDLSISFREFNERLNRRKFIGAMVLPPLAVAKQAAEFLRVEIASVLGKIEDTKRGPKGSYKRDDFEWATANYATEDHGVEEELDDRQIAIYGSEIRAEQIHRNRAINRLVMAYEAACAAATFDTDTWTGASLTTAVSNAWSDHTNGKPIDDIDAAREAVIDSCGHEPNSLVLDRYAFIQMIRTDQIEDLLKYSGDTDPARIAAAKQALADLLQLDQILIAGSPVKNTADKGQTPVFGRIWDQTMAMVCLLPTGDDDDLESAMPCIGRTLMWTEENAAIPGGDGEEIGVIVEEYREEGRRGGVIRARNDRVLKILHPEAGHLLTSVTA